MSIFTLKTPEPLEEGANWYVIRIFKTEVQTQLQLKPTPQSIEARHLEWKVPDTAYNRTMVAEYYPNFQVIEPGEAPPKKEKKPVEKKEDPEKTPEKNMGLTVSADGLKNPTEIRKLKVAIMKELTTKGIFYPNGATLKQLERIQAEAAAKKE